MQEKHEKKQCERCLSAFECKLGNITHCQCSEARITKETSQFLQSTYYDCLCKSCLVEIDKMVGLSKNRPFPLNRETLLEGLHYYLDNGLFVFTEFYHLGRGRCCNNNCRHCAYGYSNKRAPIKSSI